MTGVVAGSIALASGGGINEGSVGQSTSATSDSEGTKQDAVWGPSWVCFGIVSLALYVSW